MRASSLLFIAALIVASMADAAEKEGDVLVLTQSNFDETVNSHDVVLVEFYAPWCGHCKKLAPEYAIAATKLLKNDPPVALAKVDCTVHDKLTKRFGITGFPTLKIFRKGTPYEYKGPRDAAGIEAFMVKQAGPSAKPIKTLDDIKKLQSSTDFVVVGFFESQSSALATVFLSTADSLREYFKFAIIEDPNVAEELKLSQGVTVLKNFDEKTNTYGGSTSVGSLSEWLWEKSVPSVGEYTADTKERYTRRGLPVFKLFADVGKQGQYFLNRLRKVAEAPSVKEKLSWVFADKRTFNNELTTLGLNPTSESSVAIEDAKNSLKYKYDGTFDVEKVTEWVKQYAEGKLEPYIKSEALPVNTPGTVQIVVGKSFNDVVLDQSKDVLIEFYAPWCGHCKKLTPIYDELATAVKDVKNVVIAKMDATANDIPSNKYVARGYPTIMLAPAGNKQNPITYKGERTVTAFQNWLKSNTKSWEVEKAASGKDEL